MLRSMTGFGSARAQVEGEEIAVEIRSVNGKFCEVKIRLPRVIAALEGELVRQVKERLARGSIDLSVRRQAVGGSALMPKVDEAFAAELATSFRTLQERLGLAGEVRLSDLVAVEGLISVEERTPDLEAARRAAREALDQALTTLIEMRTREGAALAADLGSRLERIRALVAALAKEAPQAVLDHQERIARRVEELTEGVPLEPQRLAQEVALLAERSDIAEELTRLESHLVQFGQLLQDGEPVGRRLDFLVQELNREVNTVASKATFAGAAAFSVELKAEIERLREQVQNVE